MSICHTCRSTFFHFETRLPSPGGNLLEIFLLPRFLPYRSTRNFYPLILPSKRRVGKGKNPYSKRSFLDEILSENAYSTLIPKRRNCFTMGLFPSWISLIASTSFFLSLSLEKREGTSQSRQIYSRKYINFEKIY